MSQQPRVLIVDDDEMVRDTTAMVLERNGYKTTVAAGGSQGLQECKSIPFDIIISDLFMPEMDGVEFIKTLKDQGIATPVITITGGARVAQANMSADALNAGAFMTLKKPFDKKQLLNALEKVLSGKTVP